MIDTAIATGTDTGMATGSINTPTGEGGGKSDRSSHLHHDFLH
jgi:hypothetical protein